MKISPRPLRFCERIQAPIDWKAEWVQNRPECFVEGKNLLSMPVFDLRTTHRVIIRNTAKIFQLPYSDSHVSLNANTGLFISP